VCQELEPALDVAANIANTDEPSQGITRNRGDFPSEFEGYRKLFIGYQPRVSMGPANSVHQGSKVWSDIRVEGRMVFVGVRVIILPAKRPIAAGKIIGALGVNKVDLAKVRVCDTR
jgi:hypothetical protein